MILTFSGLFSYVWGLGILTFGGYFFFCLEVRDSCL